MANGVISGFLHEGRTWKLQRIAELEQSMTMSQEVDFRCVQCDRLFELTDDQVNQLMTCRVVECPHCVQLLGLHTDDLTRLVSAKDKNERKVWMFGGVTVGLPVLNIIVVLLWGSAMGFLSFFISLVVGACALPVLKDTAFVRIDLYPGTEVMQGE